MSVIEGEIDRWPETDRETDINTEHQKDITRDRICVI